MPNLKDIKNRIKSIENTQKITQAMKMVAAAKVKKAENAVKASRPYSEQVIRAFKRILANEPTFDTTKKFKKAIQNYPSLLQRRELKRFGILAITSNKGLAGAFNANVVRRTIARIKELHSQDKKVKLFIVGNKGVAGLRKFAQKNDVEIIEKYTKLPALPTAGSASVIAEDIAEAYVEERIDEIEIITTKFKSMLSFEVEDMQLLPAILEPREKKDTIEAEMVYEPSCEKILETLVPLYVSNTIYQALQEAAASELASRMQAMSSATTNAADMIASLSIVYNKARQASITQEILEVVSGADALKG